MHTDLAVVSTNINILVFSLKLFIHIKQVQPLGPVILFFFSNLLYVTLCYIALSHAMLPDLMKTRLDVVKKKSI